MIILLHYKEFTLYEAIVKTAGKLSIRLGKEYKSLVDIGLD